MSCARSGALPSVVPTGTQGSSQSQAHNGAVFLNSHSRNSFVCLLEGRMPTQLGFESRCSVSWQTGLQVSPEPSRHTYWDSGKDPLWAQPPSHSLVLVSAGFLSLTALAVPVWGTPFCTGDLFVSHWHGTPREAVPLK